MAINLHYGQSEVIEDMFVNLTVRNAVVCCCRGWGKSFLLGAAATTAIHELLELDWRVPNKNVVIIAPTFDQVTDIYYPMLAYDFGLERVAIRAITSLDGMNPLLV
jgi:tRNA(Met) C34 N-acetyltransferase TmcA